MSGRQMDRNGLSPSARSLVVAARDADAPKPEDRERVRRALAVALAASAGTAGATVTAGGAKAMAGASTATAGATATSVASVATASVLTKVAIAIVALGVGSGAIVAVNHYSSTGASTQSAQTRETPTSIAVHAPSLARVVSSEPAMVIPDEIPTDDAPIEAAPAVVTPEETPPAVAMTPPIPHRTRIVHAEADEASIDAELPVLRDALSSTARPEQRLASVDAHASRFPQSQMAPDRERARRRAVRDLCDEGPDAVARYLAAHPSSSSAPLLRETCGSSH